MADTMLQADRWLTLDSPLGSDALLATEVTGTEAISELFEFRVSALSLKKTIAPADILGKSATLAMARPGGKRRFVNGIVTSIAAGYVTRNDYRLYSLVISPTLWTLGRRSNYKVFQNKTVPDILGELLGKISYKKSLTGKYEKRDFCIQFGETDLDFFRRLVAQEGIFYYFKHTESGHKLVLGDAATAYSDADQQEIEYRQNVDDVTDAVSLFDFSSNLTGSSWTLSDYDYEKSSDLFQKTTKTALDPAKDKDWEYFRFGDGPHSDRVNALSSAAVDATDAGFEIIDGKGSTASFTPGHKFSIKKHPISQVVDKKFVLTRVVHEARDQAYFAARPGMEGKPYYRNAFSCIPADRIARQPLPPPKPVVQGPQTAFVAGGKKGEVKADEYGRIEVRFHWDREGKKNDKSSCLVRVSQPLAGSGWGGWFIPRVGMEVVVHFLDGDPDRPLVTGAVYNKEFPPPLSNDQDRTTKSGFFSQTVGASSEKKVHELSFEEAAGKERMVIHAGKDFLRKIDNDDTLDVGHDQTRTIKNNRTITISDGSDTLKLSKGDRMVEASAGQITVKAMKGITLKCGDNSVEITPQGVKVNGVSVTVTGTSKAETSAPIIKITADGMATLKGGIVKIN
ncbi:MAG TPA: type VI secretion system tip protein TssI/VgrG [Rhizobiaceae bacterium]|nr:type VI secretion system tip protein TssI/VgrG [Rhizobiaceae bacterium]